MRQELKFYRTNKAIEIEAEGQVIATIPMIEEQPQPAPEPLNLPDDLTYNLIFATNNVTDKYTGEHTMQVESVTFTPKSNG